LDSYDDADFAMLKDLEETATEHVLYKTTQA
jgi:hypothetical protein